MSDASQPDLTTLTVQLLSAYVANNSVASEDLAGLIRSTRSALEGEQPPVEPETPEFVPAVSVRKSLASREHIISLIDGKPYKTLKRHLATHGLSPAEYRNRYGLAKDYPIVAPSFAEKRRAIAERIGLGRKPTVTPASAAPEIAAPVKKTRTKAAKTTAKPGRRPKLKVAIEDQVSTSATRATRRPRRAKVEVTS